MADTNIPQAIVNAPTNNGLIEGVIRFNNSVNGMIEKTGAESWDNILALLQLQNMWYIAIGFVLFLLGNFILFYGCGFFSTKYTIAESKTGTPSDGWGLMVVASFVSGVAIICVSLFGYLFSFNVWLNALSPKLGMLYTAVGKNLAF